MYYSTAGLQTTENQAEDERQEVGGLADNQPDLDEATGSHLSWAWEHNIFSVAGYRVDTIDLITEEPWEYSPSTEDEVLSSATKMLTWLAHAVALADNILQEDDKCFTLTLGDNMLIPNRFWRTLTGGRTFNSIASSLDRTLVSEKTTDGKDGELSEHDFHAWFTYMITTLGIDDGEKIDDTTLIRAMRFRAVADSVCTGRKLATTMHGRLAVVPPDTEYGDIVCVFYGGWVPYVLRSPQNGKPCRFIGDTYIEELMHSESLAFKVNAQGPVHNDERGPNELFPML